MRLKTALIFFAFLIFSCSDSHARTRTYSFGRSSVSENWETPGYSTSINGDVQLYNTNTSSTLSLGPISSVVIRVSSYVSDSTSLKVRPVFNGTTDGDNHVMSCPADSTCTGTFNATITSDTNAPSPWTWSDLNALDVDLEAQVNKDGGNILVANIYLIVTYTSKAVQVIHIQ